MSLELKSTPAQLPAGVRLRALGVADVPAVLQIQAQCYGAQYVEGEGVFTRRLLAPHHCSWAAEHAGRLVAYLAAYWSAPGKITPLQGDFAAVPVPSVLYLHDMAVAPAAAGQGLAGALLDAVRAQALARGGITQMALVAVQDAHHYWARKGFVRCRPADVQAQQHLASYGPDACYMAQPLQPLVTNL